MSDTTPENEPSRKGEALPEKPADATANDGQSGKRRNRSTEDRRHLRAVEASQIAATPPNKADLVFTAREFITCTLPHRDPGPVLAWSRTNGNFTLAITSGIDGKTGKPYGVPYGTLPRLILVWIVTEIIRTKSRRLELGNRLSDFLLKLGLDPTRGGKCSDAQRLRIQLEKLLNALVSFEHSEVLGGQKGKAWVKIQIAPKGVFWWNEKDPEQAALWGSWIEVSEEFYKVVMAAPCPLDVRVLRHIKDSSLGIDLYTILNREAFLAMKEDKPRFLAWEWLHEQTGNECAELRVFRTNALVQVKAIMAAHHGLIISQQKPAKGRKSGLVISNLSRPSIPPEEPKRKAPRQIEGEARPAPSLSVVPPRVQHLRPAAVETFRALYRGLDPYACQAAFDAWQEGLPPEKKARHYNTAFLGFAKVWAKGKI